MGLCPEVASSSPSSRPIFPMNAPRESAGYLQNAKRRIDVKSSNQGKRKVLRSSILSLFNLGSLYRVNLTQARFPPLSRVQSSASPREVLVLWEESELVILIKGPRLLLFYVNSVLKSFFITYCQMLRQSLRRYQAILQRTNYNNFW